jgi:hypothetical protein
LPKSIMSSWNRQWSNEHFPNKTITHHSLKEVRYFPFTDQHCLHWDARLWRHQRSPRVAGKTKTRANCENTRTLSLSPTPPHTDTHERHDTVTAVPTNPLKSRNFSRQHFAFASVPNTCHDLFSDHNLCKVISTCPTTYVQLSISCLLVVSPLSFLVQKQINTHKNKNKQVPLISALAQVQRMTKMHHCQDWPK